MKQLIFIITLILSVIIDLKAQTFSPSKSIQYNGEKYKKVKIADLNGDLKNDVCIDYNNGGWTDGGYLWHQSFGVDTFSSQYNILSGIILQSSDLFDIDNDNDLDLIASIITPTGTSCISFENNGGNLTFKDTLFNSQPFTSYISKNSDLNNDGNIDIIGTHLENGSVYVTWNENNGAGSFNPLDTLIKVSNAINVSHLNVVDFDGDGNDDILINIRNPDYYLLWSKNQGNNTFTSFDTIFNVSYINNSIRTVNIGDINNDLKPDIIISQNGVDEVSYFENLTGSFSTRNLLLSNVSDNYGTLVYLDLNGDNYKDIIIGRRNNPNPGVYWYNNLTNGTFDTARFFTAQFPDYFDAGDLDADGDNDIVVANWFHQNLDWFENYSVIDPIITSTNDSICLGESVTLTVAPYIFTDWELHENSCSGPLLANDSNGVFAVTPTTTTTYYIKRAGDLNCGSIIIYVGNPLTPPTITSTGSAPLCTGDSIQLSVSMTGNNTYCWKNLAGSQGTWNMAKNYHDYSTSYEQFPKIEFHPVSNLMYNAIAKDGYLNLIKRLNDTLWVNVGSQNFAYSLNRFDFKFHPITNEPYIAFADRNNNYALTIMKYNGSTWVTVGVSSYANMNLDFIQLEFHPVSNEPYIVFEFKSGNSYEGIIHLIKHDGTSFIHLDSLNGKVPSFTFDNNNDPVIAYGRKKSSSSIGWNTIYVANYIAGSWLWKPNVLIQGRTENIDLKLSPSNQLYVAYRNDATYKNSVQKFNGTGWELIGTQNISPLEGHYNSLAFHPLTNEVYVACGGYGDGSSVLKFNGTAWELLSGSAGSGRYNDLMFDPISSDLYNIADNNYLKVFESECVSAQNPFSVDTNGVYEVFVTSEYGCTTTSVNTVDVYETPMINANIIPGNTICENENILLYQTGDAFSFNWNNGVVDSTYFPPVASNTYIVTGYDVTGNCTSTDTISTIVNPIPVADSIYASGPTTFCDGDSVVLTAPYVPGVNFCWRDSSRSWKSVGLIGSNTSSVSIDIDSSGYVYYAFNSGGANQPDARVYVQKYHDIYGWTPVGGGTPLSLDGGHEITVRVHPITKEPYVAFIDNGSGYAARVLKYTASGWTNVGTQNVSSGQADELQFEFNPVTNEPYIIFEDQNFGAALSVMKFDGANWTYVGTSGSLGSTLNSTSLSFSSLGEPYVSYYDNNYFIKKFNGTNWIDVGNISSFNIGTALSSVDRSTNTPYIAYKDVPNGNIISVIKFDGSNWVSSGSIFTTNLSYINDLKFHPITNQPYVLYEDGNDIQHLRAYDGNDWYLIGDSLYVYRGHEIGFDPISEDPYLAMEHEGMFNDQGKLFKLPSTCLGDSTSITVKKSGTYELISTNALGCYNESSNTITVTVNPLPSVLISADRPTALCAGEDIVLTQSGSATTYSWSPSINSGVAFTPSGSASYILTGIDANNCQNTDTINININSAPTSPIITMSGNPNLCLNQNIVLSVPSGSGVYYCWNDTNRTDFKSVGDTNIIFGETFTECIDYNPITNEPYIFINNIVMRFDGVSWLQVGGYIPIPSGIISETRALGFSPNTGLPYIMIESYLGTGDYRYYVYHFDGSSWVLIGGDTGINEDYSGFNIYVQPNTEDVYTIEYEDNIGSSQYYARIKKYDGTNWNTIFSLYHVYAGFGNIEFHPVTNEPYVSYSDGSVNVIKYNGNSWDYLAASGFGSYGSSSGYLKFQPGTNIPYITHYDYGKGSCYKLNGTNWEPVGTPRELFYDFALIPWFDSSTNQPGISTYNGNTKVLRKQVFDGNEWVINSRQLVNPPQYANNGHTVFEPDGNTFYVAYQVYYGWNNDSVSVYTHEGSCLGSNDTLNIDTSGVYNVMITGTNGCSVQAINPVTITSLDSIPPTVVGSISPANTVCLNETITLTGSGASTLSWNGPLNGVPFSVDSASSYVLMGTDTNNCSGYDTVMVNLYPNYYDSTTTSVCDGDSLLIHGNYEFVAGVYVDTLQSINGCDSILATTLTVNPIFSSNTNDTICQGDSVLIYGNYENTAGVYYDTLQSILGCDSVLATTLFLNANFNSNQNQEICQGDSILIYGTYQYISGTYYDSLQTINGCDSILSTTLNVNPLPNVILTNFNPDTICSSSSTVALPNGSPSGGVYSGSGVSGGTFDPSISGVGTHSVIYTYTDINSCINSDSTFITVEQCVGMDDLANDLGILIYPNPNTGLFTIEKSSKLDKEVNISLLDASSRVVINKIIPKGQQKIEMDITNYSKGVYYLQMTIGDKVYVKQILKN